MPWWAILLLALAGITSAHVRLTFPPARQPDFDFFSSSNSRLPCGVPKPPIDKGVRTFLKAGSTVDVQWTTAIPHMGGVRLEVLNSLDEPIAIFTNFLDPYNITQGGKAIVLPPGFECADCAIRITHQATEYGDNYFFYSCGDVNILKEIPDGDTCSLHGIRENGICRCKPNYYGDHCQFTADCSNNDDCGVDGLCQTSPTDGAKQCHCMGGRYGDNCEKESPSMKSSFEFNESLYNMREADNNKIFWRILNDEVEVVLRYPGESWVALGWKPQNAECPQIANQFSASTTRPSSSHPLHKVEITPREKPPATTTIRTTVQVTTRISPGITPLVTSRIATTNITTTSSNESIEECGPNEQWSTCPEMSRDCEPSCDWTRFPETIPNCPRSCGTARCVCKEGFVRMTNDEEACVPFDFCDKEAEPSCPTNSTWAKCGTACEPSCANMYDTAPCPATCEKSACTCADNYVRYQGTCIYWGDCPDIDSHFHEEHLTNQTAEIMNIPSVSVDVPIQTRITSTTRATITSTENLKCAVNETVVECGRVCEADCVSIFTRSDCDECGSPACACMQGYARNPQGTCVYWGDCPVNNSAQATTTTTSAPTTRKKIEKPSKIKVGGDVCYGDFRYPPGCSECDYKLSWNYVEDSDEIEFSLETKLMQNSWTGLGLSKDGSMVDADMMIVKSFIGKLSLHDMYSQGYGAPLKDKQQDLFTPNVIGTHSNGILRAQFMRKRKTGDKNDRSFVDECWKMMFPVNGGKLDESGNITAHIETPLVTEKEVCIRSCREEKKDTNNTSCENSYRYPANCTGDDCEYRASWTYDSAKNDIRFEISSRNIGRWTGIGFSKDGQMTNSDIYTGWVYEGKAFVTDRFAYGRQLPAIDPADRQNIYDIGGKIEDDVQTLWFRRPVLSKDHLTDFPLDECWYFLFPIGGGRVLARKSSDFTNPRTPIGYHDLYQPRSSLNKICICDADGKRISARSRTRREVVLANSPPIVTKPNAMECTDMVVGSVIDGRGRVRDFYSPSKATPRPDSVFGGSDSLTAAAAFREDGITTVVFRKKLQADDEWDHTIKGPMTVIWAKGANPNNYQHTTGGAPIKADPDFFTSDAFKYHGRNQRGVLTIDFLKDTKKEQLKHGLHIDASTCSGSFSFPADCIESDAETPCQYVMRWVSDGEVARFSVEAKMKTSQWVAVGFSPDGGMAGSDAVIIGIQRDDVVTVTDQFMPNYGRPIIDEQQDIFDVETNYDEGILTANFSRELFSNDKNDINLQDCVHLLFTITANQIEPTGEIRKHGETPIASQTKVCLNTCSELPSTVKILKGGAKEAGKPETPKTPTATTEPTRPETKTKSTTVLQMPPIIKQAPPFVVYEPTEPAKSRYGLRVRILNKEYVPALADPQSEYYQSFTKTVTSAVNDLLAKRWKGMQVSKLIGYSKGSVIAEFEVVSERDAPRPIEVKSLFEENAVRGTIGELAIEPSTIKAHAIDSTPTMEEPEFGKAFVRNLVIIGAAALLLIFAVTCTCCLLCRVRKSSRYNSYPVPHPTPYLYGNGMAKAPAGFDNAAFFNHQRHYSQATTASTKNGNSPQSAEGRGETPGGIGETTYQEWYSKVGSKPASQQHEEAPVTATRPPSTTPYVSYPNDPSGYYTLGGEHRTESGPKHFRSPF
uniref:EGF-like domain-containing protein n=1 Tax=Haemonchus contortus TaxID=6289 RepID=A0A7I4Y0F5_HAECO